MAFTLPDLPYSHDALTPFMSKISPLAVGIMLKASPYQEAMPILSYFGSSFGTYQTPPT